MKEFDAEIFVEKLAAPFIWLAFILVHVCWPGYLTRKMQRIDNYEAAYLTRTMIKMPFVRSVEVDRKTKKVVLRYPSYIQDTRLLETIRQKTGLNIDLAPKPLKKES